MNLRLLPLALLLCAGLAQAHAPGRPTPQAIDEVVQATIARYDLPGIAVGVIVDGEVVYAKGHGETVAGSGDPVGPVCETGDTFATDRMLPRCEAGDLVAILAAGAYGASMASSYNSRPLPAEVLVEAGRYALVRRRQSFEEMLAGEQAASDWKAP